MVSPPSPPTKWFQFTKESISQPIEKKIGPLLVLFLFLSTIFLLARFYSPLPLTYTNKETPGDDQNSNRGNVSTIVTNETEETCDASIGKWVNDPRGPVYTNVTCKLVPGKANCQLYGKDPNYLYWRWKPHGCELPRFEPERCLEILRGKKLAFIGDSLARNQMESMLCLLSQAEDPVETYKDAFDQYRTYYFPSHNFTLMVMWTEFFVEGFQKMNNGTPSASFDIHLDRIRTNWSSRLSDLDYAVLSGGNWLSRTNYLHEGGKLIGCVNCREGDLTDFGWAATVRIVLRKALETVIDCEKCDRLVTFVRTFVAPQFENGQWFNGGDCIKKIPLEESELDMNGIEWEIRKVQVQEMERVREMGLDRKFEILDVTKAMMLRADGHPGAYYNGKLVTGISDCLHWCVPGPADTLNEILMLRIMNDLSLK